MTLKRIIVIVCLAIIFFLSTAGSATPGDNSFARNRIITIHGSPAGTQINYPVKMILFNATARDASGGIVLDTPELLSPSWKDIRFSGGSDMNFYPYWIESANETSATIWVNVPVIPQDGTEIAIHYGNPDEPDQQDGDATFTLFDNFNQTGPDISKWKITKGVTVSKGIVTCTASSDDAYGITSVRQFETGYRIVARIRPHDVGGIDTAEYFRPSYFNDNTQDTAHYSHILPQFTGKYYNGNGSTGTREYYQGSPFTIGKNIEGIVANSWNRHEAIKDTGKIIWRENLQKAYEFTSNYYSGPGSVRFASYHAGTIDVDWVFVGKYVYPEPYVIPSMDENANGGISDTSGITLTKIIAPDSIKAGTETTVNITLSNAGSSPIHDIEILDTVPPEFSVVNGKMKYADAGIVRTDETRTLAYTIRPEKAGIFTIDGAQVLYADQDGNYHRIRSNIARVDVIEPLFRQSNDPLTDWISSLSSWFK